MKVTFTVDFEVEPEKPLSAKEIANVTGMLTRVCRNRLNALFGQRLGGERQPTGWEVQVKGIEVSANSKMK